MNEELYTVNSEYQSKVNELAGANNDLANFLSTTLVGVLMVDRDLNIRKFTEYISTEFSVAEQDVGRSLRFIAYNFGTIDMIAMCREVLRTMTPIEHHCASITGCTYLIRIAPYWAQEAENVGMEPAEKKPEKLQGLVLTFVDTTKQVDDKQQIEEISRALRQAVKSSQEKETFLSHMSHDMRTPMSAIYGLTELSLGEDNIPEDVRDNLEKIRTSSNYMLSLIDEILETSRINAGKVVAVTSTVREDTLLFDIAAIIRERAAEANQHFSSEIRGCRSRYVLMDTEHVERILLNLLSNAVKYTPQGGNIRLQTTVTYTGEKAKHVYIITDSGRGMSEAFQSRMYLPFEQEAVDSTSREGTGLGLYICKNLIDMLGGTISCTSHPGEGTEFVVTLTYDLATKEQIRLHSQQLHTYEDQLLYGKNVLVAEDNNLNAEVVIKLLSKKGIHAELARDGQEAVELFRRKGPFHFQAILMDVRMPVKDGLQAAREIRQSGLEDAASIPIFALMADIQEETEQKCRDCGMDGCLTKPMDMDQLVAKLSKAFEEQQDKA